MANQHSGHKLEEGTLADRISKQLVEAIITGDLAQGHKLSESELATRFNTSRGPLREAIRRLEGMRLVKRIPHAGARVTSLDHDSMAELYQVREALEGMACRIAATHMEEEKIAYLRRLLDEHEQAINEADGQHYIQHEANFDFHYQIVQASNNHLLSDLLLGELYQLLRMCRFQTGNQAERTIPALQQHRQILEAIANRDPEMAELLMKRHISGAWKTMQSMMNTDNQGG